MLKDLLCVVGAGEQPSAALPQALALARGYSVSSQYVVAVPGPPPVSNILETDLVEVLIEKAKSKAAEAVEHVSTRIVELSRAQGLSPNLIKDSRPLADIAAAVATTAQSYDLALLDRVDSIVGMSSAIFEAALFGSGRPVLLVSPDFAPVERFGTAVFAWDGSAGAARALAAALSLFPDLKEICVLTIVGEKNLGDLVPGADIAAHIRRHGIATTVACVDLETKDGNAGPAIARFAATKNADLIVMGGYGHSRLREFILGGVTEYLSRRAKVPLLLAH